MVFMLQFPTMKKLEYRVTLIPTMISIDVGMKHSFLFLCKPKPTTHKATTRISSKMLASKLAQHPRPKVVPVMMPFPM